MQVLILESCFEIREIHNYFYEPILKGGNIMWIEDHYVMTGRDWLGLSVFAFCCGAYVAATFPLVKKWFREKFPYI